MISWNRETIRAIFMNYVEPSNVCSKVTAKNGRVDKIDRVTYVPTAPGDSWRILFFSKDQLAEDANRFWDDNTVSKSIVSEDRTKLKQPKRSVLLSIPQYFPAGSEILEFSLLRRTFLVRER